jgi:hypothetical protein
MSTEELEELRQLALKHEAQQDEPEGPGWIEVEEL